LERVVEAVELFCSSLIPDDVKEGLDGDLFTVNSVSMKESLSIEISSPFRKVRGIIIGRRGKNIQAIRHLIRVIGYQEKFTIISVAVVE